ncbi:MAG: hypothetical protein QNJ65_15870 [Xenococcaceae cyanobacterium MO_234.B1]|nr:hypothetical protein [Xenococcaceae cyanobacterium MO_234.B1]
MSFTERQKIWETTVSRLIAKAWLDQDFYQRFISNPAEILREAGLILEDVAKVIVNHDSLAAPILTGSDGGTMTYQINLPPKPAGINDEQISTWAAGMIKENNNGSCGCSC